jgi:adenosylcobinamide-GDP ribazoletransferase
VTKQGQRLWVQLLAAVTLLTRLPVAGWAVGHSWPAAEDAVWAYPIAGFLVGGAGAAVLWMAQRSGCAPAVAATLAVTAMVLLGGGLHEDGLADTADGFGGGATAARKLEIMRDSRIGSYGALALVLTTGLRITALAAMPTGRAAMALLAAGALSRGAMILALLLLRPARADGVAASLGGARRVTGIAGLALAAAASLFLPWAQAALCCAAAFAAALLVARLARRQIGGYTGDVLGCTAVTCECAALVAAGLAV